jgi:hypothetical protein
LENIQGIFLKEKIKKQNLNKCLWENLRTKICEKKLFEYKKFVNKLSWKKWKTFRKTFWENFWKNIKQKFVRKI